MKSKLYHGAMIRSILGFVGLIAASGSFAAPVMTNFDPASQGLHFVNRLTRDLKISDIKWPGYCGGMTYTALDYYNAHKNVPMQTWCPATGTVLEEYIWGRQSESVSSNIDKWLEVILNPAGARDTEFFDWGLQTQPGSRIAELKQFIDRGIPVPLGLKGAGGYGDHQVLAIGYDMGRYNGSNPAMREDFKIFCYNPNYPDQTTILKPVVAERIFQVDGQSDKYRTWFVNRNYHAAAPPVIANQNFPHDGKVHSIVLTFDTGTDDMRGGYNNLDVTVNGMDGFQQRFTNVNMGQPWIGNYSQSVELVLRTPMTVGNLKSLDLFHEARGDFPQSPDNWDMQKMHVLCIGGNVRVPLTDTLYHRFTNDNKQFTITYRAAPPTPANMVGSLSLDIKTADDDLRGGGSDNLDLIVTFDDNSTQRFDNVNRGAKWDNNSTHNVVVVFNRAHPWNGVKRVKLIKNANGGIDGDNWSMASVRINAVLGRNHFLIGSHDYCRFTGDSKELAIDIRTDLPRPPGT